MRLRARIFRAVPSKERIIDAEFEVVVGPYRLGEQHRRKKRWLFTGRYDAKGRMLWYRPPRFNKWQFTGVALLSVAVIWLVVVGAILAWDHFFD